MSKTDKTGKTRQDPPDLPEYAPTGGYSPYHRFLLPIITDGELAPGGQGPAGEDGEDGLSAYEIAVKNGFAGSEAEWLASLVGPPGEDGADGNTFNIIGTVPTVDDLPAERPDGAQLENGDGFIIAETGELYVWNGSLWVNYGNLTGPPGPPGPPGDYDDAALWESQGEQDEAISANEKSIKWTEREVGILNVALDRHIKSEDAHGLEITELAEYLQTDLEEMASFRYTDWGPHLGADVKPGVCAFSSAGPPTNIGLNHEPISGGKFMWDEKFPVGSTIVILGENGGEISMLVADSTRGGTNSRGHTFEGDVSMKGTFEPDETVTLYRGARALGLTAREAVVGSSSWGPRIAALEDADGSDADVTDHNRDIEAHPVLASGPATGNLNDENGEPRVGRLFNIQNYLPVGFASTGSYRPVISILGNDQDAPSKRRVNAEIHADGKIMRFDKLDEDLRPGQYVWKEALDVEIAAAIDAIPDGGGVPPRFLSDLAYKDNAFQYPRSFDMRAGGSAATGPHRTVTEINLRISRDDPFWETADALYAESPGCPILWYDGDGRTTHYLVRSVEVVPYDQGTAYDKFVFTVIYDPPPGGDAGVDTSMRWDDYSTPFSIEIQFPEDVITREMLAASDWASESYVQTSITEERDRLERTGITFTAAPTPIFWNGHASRGQEIIKIRSSWNGGYPITLHHDGTDYGRVRWTFASDANGFPGAMIWTFGTREVVRMDASGLKVNGSSVSRSSDLLTAARGATSFEDFRDRLVAMLEEREAEEARAEAEDAEIQAAEDAEGGE